MLLQWNRLVNGKTVKASKKLSQKKQTTGGKAIALSISVASIVGTLTWACLNSASALAAQLTQWTFDHHTQRLELTLSEGTTPQYFLLAQPPRIVIDLSNTQVGSVADVQTYPGVVRSIRVGQFQPDLTRIVMELEADAVFSPGHIEIQALPLSSVSEEHGLARWRIRPLIVGYEQFNLSEHPSTPPFAISPGTNATNTRESLLAQALNASPSPESLSEGLPDSRTNLLSSNVVSTVESDREGLTSGLPPLEPGALELPIELIDSDWESSGASIAISTPKPSQTERATSQADGATRVNTEATNYQGTGGVPNRALFSVPVIEFGQQWQGQTDESESGFSVFLDSNDNLGFLETHETLDQNGSENELKPVTGVSSIDVMDEIDGVNVIDEAGEGAVPEVVTNIVSEAGVPEVIPEALPDVESLAIAASNERAESELAESELVESELVENELVENEQISNEQIENERVSSELMGRVATHTSPIIPHGTVVTLRYPRNVTFALNNTSRRQEILVTTHEISDRAGTLLVPTGSLVIGQFEKSGRNSLRFVAHALRVGNDTVPLAQSIAELPNTASITPNQFIDLQIQQAIELPRPLLSF